MRTKTIKNLYRFGKIKPVRIQTWVALDIALLAAVSILLMMVVYAK